MGYNKDALEMENRRCFKCLNGLASAPQCSISNYAQEIHKYATSSDNVAAETNTIKTLSQQCCGMLGLESWSFPSLFPEWVIYPCDLLFWQGVSGYLWHNLWATKIIILEMILLQIYWVSCPTCACFGATRPAEFVSCASHPCLISLFIHRVTMVSTFRITFEK